MARSIHTAVSSSSDVSSNDSKPAAQGPTRRETFALGAAALGATVVTVLAKNARASGSWSGGGGGGGGNSRNNGNRGNRGGGRH